ncbi:Holliday junction branch migration protein RuvA [Salinibacillus xinjiangensis]|uniref:Holliday junction branch migration complex subunit RuvA n=1 Tax=Salinibacillus xinjiangensis TaxID=1229268 RepID=A0A6G1XB50_9BACI|nr:Holliday junction branch migration protein RuvA [Salinibacillus xinjiangensis]MRG88243.1 Holliday junction branch migration protein RuvA [Salinibacillus xinjiangensis]
MIAFLEGKIDTIDEQSVFVLVNGVGYEVVCANPFQFQHQINEQVRIYTYHYIREDQQLLYGFQKVEEKQLFAKLLNVSGIGPKSALSILATTSAAEVAAAIEHEDEKFLTKFPGVGKKTARQMILDLKGKVTEWIQHPVYDQDSTHGTNDQLLQDGQRVHFEEALEALKALGYSEREVQRISPSLRQETYHTVDEYIKKGLSLMLNQ